MNQTFMKEKKILPLVLSMALPMVISMAVNSLYNIVDSYFVAKVSEDAMTALSLVYPVQNLITAIAVGFGVGINAAVAFHLGAGEKERANRAASQGILFSIVHGILLLIVCIAGMPFFLRLFTSESSVMELALSYSNLAFLFAPFITVGIGYEKIFQAVGHMRETMVSMVLGFVTNIVLDPLLIFGIGFFPEMGMRGAALATGIGQTVTFAVYFVFYFIRPLPVEVSKKYFAVDRQILGKLYAVGVPATLNMALPSVLISALNGILAAFSASYVLVLGVYYKLQTFIYLTANGLVQGIRPLVGYNYGAGEHGRVKKIYLTALAIAVMIMTVGTALSWLIPAQMFGLFTTNPETIAMGVSALHIISLGFIVSAVSVTSCGALEGLGKGMPSLWISLFRYILLIIPAAFLLSRMLGAAGVWWAFCLTEAVTAVISIFIYRRNARA